MDERVTPAMKLAMKHSIATAAGYIAPGEALTSLDQDICVMKFVEHIAASGNAQLLGSLVLIMASYIDQPDA